MTRSPTIRPNSYFNNAIIFGQIIENLFFYKQTIAHIGRHEIKSLYTLADVDVVEELLKYHGLNIYYNNSHSGISNQDGIRFIDLFSLANLDLEKELYTESFAFSGDKKRCRKFARKISRLIKEYNLPKEFNKNIYSDIKNESFLNQILIDRLSDHNPDLWTIVDKLHMEMEFLDDTHFKIHSNFKELGVDPKQFSPDSVLTRIASASEDLQVMAENASEINTSERNARVIHAKIGSALDQATKSKREKEVFSHYVFDDSWALSEAINKKRIHVKAALQVLRKAERYKAWLQDIPNDANLMREYVAKAGEKNILERMPAKAIRFYIFNGLAEILSTLDPAIGLPLTLTASAFDTFLLEKLGTQWKPNQFIEQDLRPLVKNSGN